MKKKQRKYSLGRRFSYTLTGIVTTILFTFSTVVIVYNTRKIERELQQYIERIVKLSETSLSSSVWNMSYSSVNDFVDAIFVDESVVFARVVTENIEIAKKCRDEFKGADFSLFRDSDNFIVRTVNIRQSGRDIGTFQIAVSPAAARKELVLNIAGVATLTLVIILAITLTSIVITRKYIFRPLTELEKSATAIANGNLETRIRINGNDEIGILAKALDDMRGSIGRLVDDLRDANIKLEEYNKTLEQKVDERTSELNIKNEELREIIGEVRRSKEVAEFASRAKSRFLASMSHEIRTPINAILGMAEVLWETRLTNEQVQYVKVFKSAGESLLNIINDILDLSKIEAGELELEYATFDPRNLAEKTCEIFAVRAHGKGLELAGRVNPNVPFQLLGDSFRLRQVLTNLMGNAVKFTESGTVFLEVSSVAKQNDPAPEGFADVRFSVTDTGIGISPEMISIIFDSFKQVDSSITRKYGGSGLGLNISKYLVEKMGGRLEVSSAPSAGSEFHFTIRFEIPDGSFREPPELDLDGARILVADCHQINRKILCDFIAEWNAVAEEAETETAMLDAIVRASVEGDDYSFAIIDSHISGNSEFDVNKMKKCVDASKVVLMLRSNYTSDDIERTGGFSHYLVKPLKRLNVGESITAMLRRQKTVVPQKVEEIQEFPEIPHMRILLVDDSENNRYVVGHLLKNTPCRIDMAENGKIGLEMFKQGRYDLILMDIQMPEMDGYTAMREIRKWENAGNLKPVPIIAMTAFALKGDSEKCYEAGSNAYLSKPVAKKKLLETIALYAGKAVEIGRAGRIEKKSAKEVEGVSSQEAAKLGRIEKESAKGSLPIPIQIDSDLKEIVPSYLESVGKKTADAILLADKRDFEKIRFFGHQMKGEGGAFGFPKISELGAVLQKAAEEKDDAGIRDTVSMLSDYLERIEISYY